MRQSAPTGLAFADDPDAPGAFGDKDTPGAIIGCGHPDRIVKSIGHLDERQFRGARYFSTWLCNIRRRRRRLLC